MKIKPKVMKAYRGMNLLLTSMKGYDSPYWLSMKQVNTKGGKVKKGERATCAKIGRKIK